MWASFKQSWKYRQFYSIVWKGVERRTASQSEMKINSWLGKIGYLAAQAFILLQRSLDHIVVGLLNGTGSPYISACKYYMAKIILVLIDSVSNDIPIWHHIGALWLPKQGDTIPIYSSVRLVWVVYWLDELLQSCCQSDRKNIVWSRSENIMMIRLCRT